MGVGQGGEKAGFIEFHGKRLVLLVQADGSGRFFQAGVEEMGCEAFGLRLGGFSKEYGIGSGHLSATQRDALPTV